MADEREQQIREHLEDGRYSWHTSPDLAYLLDALAAAREENGRLRERYDECVAEASQMSQRVEEMSERAVARLSLDNPLNPHDHEVIRTALDVDVLEVVTALAEDGGVPQQQP